MAKHGDEWVSKCGLMTLRCGDYREVLRDVQCDAVITDPPYGLKTHEGHRASADGHLGDGNDQATRRALSYSSWDGDDIGGLCEFVARHCRGWCVSMTSHDLLPNWYAHHESHGRYVFAPVPLVIFGMTCRLGGDGPSSWAVYCVVARPRTAEYAAWGTLPGAYTSKPYRKGHIGGKPLPAMAAIVRDYSRKGDLVCDPCAGGGTTLLAAAMEGRRAIGAEIDPETFELAVKRLSAGYTPDLFAGVQP